MTKVLLEDIKKRCRRGREGWFLRVSHLLAFVSCCLLSLCSISQAVCSILVFVNVCVFSEIIDLSDESGHLKNLLEHKSEYATEILKARHSFILIRVDSEY